MGRLIIKSEKSIAAVQDIGAQVGTVHFIGYAENGRKQHKLQQQLDSRSHAVPRL
jgi:hypothetical protein